MPRIFDAFDQADRAITRQFGGLGLAWPSANRSWRLHGGTIEAHSAGEGKGSSFRVRLPLLVPMGPQLLFRLLPSNPEQRFPSTRRLRILVVEDHGDTAEMIRLILEGEGHQVQTAGAVATAVQAASEGTFDLLLSDLGLPDGSGLDLIRELRAQGHQMPAIALSGYGQESDLEQTRAAGFVTHIVKPVDMDRLVSAIARLVSR